MPDELDDRLQRALSTYAAAQPLAGLEDRILQKVQTSRKSGGMAYWILASAACLLLLLLIPAIHQPKQKATVSAPFAGKLITSLTAEKIAAKPKRVRFGKRSHPAWTPRPTHEELLLARYVAADPEGAAKAFSSLNESIDHDIAIPPLVVEPIKIEPLP